MTSSTLTKLPRLNAPQLHYLPNGLTIVAEQMPVDAVNLNLWLNVGSYVEPDAINGMAHFLEHMVFKGTERLVSGEFERRIEERGAVTNAATSQDYTHYHVTCAPQDFAKLAPLQIDVVLNPTIADDAFERERLVVLEEIRRSEDNPRRRVFTRVMELGFANSPYQRGVLGEEGVICQLQAQQMRDFHAHWYQPQSMTAVVVGNLPVEDLVSIVAEGFSEYGNCRDLNQELHQALNQKFSQQHNQPFSIYSNYKNYQSDVVVPFTDIFRQEYVDETLQQARLILLWRVPGLNQLNQTYALDILSGILGHGRTSRLVRDLREERGLVSHIGASNMNLQKQGLFYISAQCAVENIPEVEVAILDNIRTLQTELVSEAEINRICKKVANRFIFSNETPSDRASLYGFYQSLIGDLEPAFDYPMHIQRQAADDLMQAAQDYLSPDAYGVVVVKPN
ncbi:pitrilysin family protein [Calothrix sp. UHCC 0171]|uniref:M16 family metallopeptidase n=1 Tax=Calothrix sp. UHCC 0171 TaxID=3110245 RepID=UPI002B205413|nr:pitrilysin family protein [Calothrix sp. UHCC 0171]MEA5574328.1 pitrilysin family protein [Calothrix sp. UHCC 0171]